MNDERMPALRVRAGAASDLEPCVAVWAAACAVRDGRAIDGVAERARGKFAHAVTCVVADGPDGIHGFALATEPGSGMPTDPSGVPVLGLLAVAPDAQARGLGRTLLRAAMTQLADLGYEQAVLHALTDNVAAIRLYESAGWHPVGEEFAHSLLGRPMRTYLCALGGP